MPMYQSAMNQKKKMLYNKLHQNSVAYNNKYLFCIYTLAGFTLCFELQRENVQAH